MAKAAKASGKKALTKSAFVAHVAEKTELTKKQVEAVLEEVIEVVKTQLTKGAGKFVFPGLARITLTPVKAREGGQKKINPLNGKEYETKPRAAFNKVNIRPIKAIKTALA